MNGVSRFRYFAAVLLFCVAWSSAFPSAKLAIATSPPALFQGIRFLATAAILLGYALWRGDLRGRVPWGQLAMLGLLNQAGYQGLAWQGMSTVSAGLATIIASLNPILIAVVAAPLLGERLHARKIAGLLLGFAGAVYVVRHRIVANGEDPAGVLLVVGALLSMVAGTLAFKRMAPQATLPVAVGVQVLSAGAVLLVLGLLFEDRRAVVYGAQYWLVMAWFVVVVSIGAFLLWFWLLRTGSASNASALHFLMPPLGLGMSWLALGERVSASDWLGVAPIGVGIWLAPRPEPAGRIGDEARRLEPVTQRSPD